jgi:hypothetical protein
MPNWAENVLYVTKGDATLVWDAIHNPDRLQNPKYPDYDDTAFDFNRLIPMPEELHNCGPIGTMSRIADDLLAGNGIGDFAQYRWVKEAGIVTVEQLCAHWNYDYNEVVALGKLRQENREKYGCADWYEWHNNNWGTKWNACNVHFSYKPEYKGTVLVFDTAWAPPMPVMEKLFAMFPDHEFKYSWWETTNSFGDLYIVRNGKIVEGEKLKITCMHADCENEGTEMAADCLYYCAKHAAESEEHDFGFDRDEQALQQWEAGQQ